MKTQIEKIIFAYLTFITFLSQAQTEPTRVSFTIKNPSIKVKTVDFKSYSVTLLRMIFGIFHLSLSIEDITFLSFQ